MYETLFTDVLRATIIWQYMLTSIDVHVYMGLYIKKLITVSCTGKYVSYIFEHIFHNFSSPTCSYQVRPYKSSRYSCSNCDVTSKKNQHNNTQYPQELSAINPAHDEYNWRRWTGHQYVRAGRVGVKMHAFQHPALLHGCKNAYILAPSLTARL